MNFHRRNRCDAGNESVYHDRHPAGCGGKVTSGKAGKIKSANL
jgi:hypothetical protein